MHSLYKLQMMLLSITIKKVFCLQSKHWKYATHFIPIFRLLFIFRWIWNLMKWSTQNPCHPLGGSETCRCIQTPTRIHICMHIQRERDRQTDRQTNRDREKTSFRVFFFSHTKQNDGYHSSSCFIYLDSQECQFSNSASFKTGKKKKKTSLFFFKCRNIRMAFRQSSLFCSTKENIKSDASMPVLLGTWKLEHNSITSL